jgi:hydroxymethylglutaryl-CoA reductase
MQKRGGGILDITLGIKQIYSLIIINCMRHLKPKTAWSHFQFLPRTICENVKETKLSITLFSDSEKEIQVIMSILSNYVPNCLVRAEVSCPIADLQKKHIDNPLDWRFVQAVQIAELSL